MTAGTFQTLIVHDSFYGTYSIATDPDCFPDPMSMLSFSEDNVSVANRIVGRPADHQCDRAQVRDRGKETFWTWDSDISIAIVQRGTCSGRRIAAPLAQPTRRCRGDETTRATSPFGLSQRGHLPCLRLSVTAEERATLEIALPDPKTGAFEPGRTLEYRIAPGARTIAFVLPAYAAGSNVRVSLDDDAAISAIEVGEIPAIRPVAPSQP